MQSIYDDSYQRFISRPSGLTHLVYEPNKHIDDLIKINKLGI